MDRGGFTLAGPRCLQFEDDAASRFGDAGAVLVRVLCQFGAVQGGDASTSLRELGGFGVVEVALSAAERRGWRPGQPWQPGVRDASVQTLAKGGEEVASWRPVPFLPCWAVR